MEERQKIKYVRPDGVLSPIKAIRAHCIGCMCGQMNEVKLCPSSDCPLYAYRLGHKPREGMSVYTQDEDTGKTKLASTLQGKTLDTGDTQELTSNTVSSADALYQKSLYRRGVRGRVNGIHV